MALDDFAARFDTAGTDLADAAAALPRHDPGAGAFGAVVTGQLGALGRELHRIYLSALDSRVREAAAHAARLSATADALTRTAARYAEADDSARRRHGEAS
ncbi:hypothetical protein HC028_04235 [Planosporangium flavigriseum]|uniref:Excreted virulence factor EspC, type VII ESX diderm n=1 Tax=Planosporangium flavigriseum TaxID=373681 RepID=A0A8J3PKV2_9ACTN|nr:hypothetical protein [Planosporangium flavigriseum]NJC63719.1 hypothetical protein [Planosporangium flavigriseum]GIG73786.1 hypothetical protein Pfl04_21900 [Planosporangium flavigriseum]